MRSLLVVAAIIGLEILCAHGCHAQQVIAGARTSHGVAILLLDKPVGGTGECSTLPAVVAVPASHDVRRALWGCWQPAPNGVDVEAIFPDHRVVYPRSAFHPIHHGPEV
jgi:hypothetical protein